jgi:methylated-DNA-[protein]-cysteine S-methyltransferase
MIMPTATVSSPIGPLTLIATDHALTEIRFGADDDAPDAPDDARDHPIVAAAAAQLAAYFAGARRTFDLPLAPTGTAFQRAVWRALGDVAYGQTTGYGALARALGRPTAARAVGAANGANPLPIVVPCHRVIGADGTLTGYAGGLTIKRWLLAHEAATAARIPYFSSL